VMLPVTLMLAVAFALGATFPGVDGLVMALAMCAGFALVAASWGSLVALATRTQAAGPLMIAPMILAVMLTASYAPNELLAGWLQDVADWNPVTEILTTARQGFVADVTWESTWPGLVALGALVSVHFLAALSRLRKFDR
jgi:ABC-2 type transport system permease protein